MLIAAFAIAVAAPGPVAAKPMTVYATPNAHTETPEEAELHREGRKQSAAQCAKGFQDYCYYLGRMMKLGFGGPADPDGARALFERACLGHVTDACLELDPHFIDADLRKTAELGCRDGDQRFCVQLASMLEHGIGGPADPTRASHLLEVACRKGYANACVPVER